MKFPFKTQLKSVRDVVMGLGYVGNNRYCPVCEKKFRKFLPNGVFQRPDARCPACHSVERHRLVWLYFQKRTNLFDDQPKKILHVAPEACFEKRLHKILGDGYITADLMDPNVMVQMDVTDIQYSNDSFDVVYCSHVLEHVEDDRKAMREFWRVLKPNGWAIILVPIMCDKTIEDPTITDPAERLRLFYQEDHVRCYGPDYKDRLIESGFIVKVSSVSDLVEDEGMVQMGLAPDHAGDIYFCTK